VTLTGSRSDGAPIDAVIPFVGSGVQQLVIPNTSGSTPNVAFVVVPELRVQVVVSRSVNGPVTDVRYAAPFVRVDNEAPSSGSSYAFGTQNTNGSWVGAGYVFTSSPGNGFTSSSTGDGVGVGRTTVRFEAAPINTTIQSCASTQAGLTFTPITATTALAETAGTGVPPGPSYCLRFVETDALANARTTFVSTTFGVDKQAPTILREMPGTPGDRTIYRSGASAAAATFSLELRDTLSGLDGTPLNYSLRRLTTTGVGCVVGTGINCGGVDGPQSVIASGLERVAAVSLTSGSSISGMYTLAGVARDWAGNSSVSFSRQVLVDAQPPTVSRVRFPNTPLNVPTFVAFADVTDDLDLGGLIASLTYPVGQFRCGTSSLGVAFDPTYTTSVSHGMVPCSFMRSLSASPSVTGAKPTTLSMRALDAAGNSSASVSESVDPQGIVSTSYTFSSVGLSGFRIVPHEASVQVNTSLAMSWETWGPVGTYDNPFSRTQLYYRVSGGEWIPLSAVTIATLSEEATGRYYRYTTSFVVNQVAGGTSIQLLVVGTTGSGDALATASTSINVTP
jgi:hypothetical protein